MNVKCCVMATIVAITMCLSCQNSHKQPTDYENMPHFETCFPEKTLSIGELYVKQNCDSLISFSSMEEAEWKLVHYFFPDGNDTLNKESYDFDFDYDLFAEVVMSDTSSMNYPFDSICHYADIRILDSKDGKLRFYVWEPPHFGRGSNAFTLAQYRWNGEIRYQENLYGGWTGESPFKLDMMHVDDKDYYLTSDYFFFSSEVFCGYSVYVLTDSGLVEVAGQEGTEENGREHALFYEYYPGDWYFRTSGMGEWLDYFDETTNTLYVPDEDVFMNDRYKCYQWDGKQFVQVGNKSVANPFLHPSLKDYERLEYYGPMDRKIVRVDKLGKESYRYAAWQENSPMSSKPERVITNGTLDTAANEFVFRDNGQEYRIPVVE